jgi:hypothetical protein
LQKKKEPHLNKADVVELAVADASAEGVEVMMIMLYLVCKVVVVDVDASRAVVLENTLADTAGELLVRYGR